MSPGRSPWQRQVASTTRGGALEQRIDLSGRWGDGGRAGRPAPTFIFGCYASMPPPNIARIVSGSVAHAGGGGSSCGSSPTGPRGRWKGRAPIPRAYLGADFYFWLLCLDTPPDYRLDHVRERRSCGGDRMKLWFVTNGPQGAWEGPGAMSGSVAHASPLKKKYKMRKFSQLQSHYQNAKIFTLSMMRKFFYSWVGPRRPVAVGRSDAGRGSLRPLTSHNSKCF